MNRVFFLLLLLSFTGNAQRFVQLQDERFAAALRENFPESMKGNFMNIDAEDILAAESLDLNGRHIASLDGLQYFVHLKELKCVENELSYLPKLPAGLLILDCSMNKLRKLPVLPEGLQELSCAVNELSELPDLPKGLLILYCNYNNLTSIPSLPVQLEYLSCGSNQLTCVPTIPETVFFGDIALNPLICIPSVETWMDRSIAKLPVCQPSVNDRLGHNKCICISSSLVSLEEESKELVLQPSLEENEQSWLENGDLLVSIYPNPTRGMISIRANYAINQVVLRDVKGKLMIAQIEHSINDESMGIDLSLFPKGIYFVQLSIGSEVVTHKVVKAN